MVEEQLRKIGRVSNKAAIIDAKRHLANSHGVAESDIRHCIDGIAGELGPNRKFAALREKIFISGVEREITHLQIVKKSGTMEVLPHRYLGSALHTDLTAKQGREVYVHFYIKR